MVLDGRWGNRNREGPPEEGRGEQGGADAVGGGPMRRGEENREGSPVLLPSLIGAATHGFLITPKPSNATNAVWAGSYDPFGACFGLNSVNYPPPPPPLPGGIPAVCRLHSLRRQYLYPTRCEKVVLCATVPSASFSSAPNLRRAERSPPPISRRDAKLALALAWGRGGGGACGARAKRPRLNPQLARANFLPLQEEARSFALSRDIFLPGRRSVDAAPFPPP